MCILCNGAFLLLKNKIIMKNTYIYFISSFLLIKAVTEILGRITIIIGGMIRLILMRRLWYRNNNQYLNYCKQTEIFPI